MHISLFLAAKGCNEVWALEAGFTILDLKSTGIS
jgi:hypothetical protein